MLTYLFKGVTSNWEELQYNINHLAPDYMASTTINSWHMSIKSARVVERNFFVLPIHIKIPLCDMFSLCESIVD